MMDDLMLIYVDCGDNATMAIPRPNREGGIEWRLRYGNPQEVRYDAATVIASYSYLVSGEINMAEATRRLRLLRRAKRNAHAALKAEATNE
jgi:hypothetical protein